MIAAVGKNGELGKDGKLIWSIKEDLQFFRDITMGHNIIMGRKTFDSLPKLLDGRKHIVLTKSNKIIPNVEMRGYLKGLITEYKNKDAFIIGGSSVYSQFMPFAENIYLTEIDSICKEADTFFPRFERDSFEREILSENHDEVLNLDYKHVLYKRRH